MKKAPFDNSEHHDSDHLPDDLRAVDLMVSKALRDQSARSHDPELANRVFASTVDGLKPKSLPFTPASSRQAPLRLAASLFLAAGIGVAIWFASSNLSRDTQSPTNAQEMALDSMSTELGPSSFEEVMLVSVLEGDGSWIDADGFVHDSHIDAESVLRTRGTSVDDLADEISSILGMTF
jgi:hypothetical protein